MTERDYKILIKINEKLRELSSTAESFNIENQHDLSKVHSVTRRGIVGFIADIYELAKPLSEAVQLPFREKLIKNFRNTSTHQYGKITNALAYLCLKNCIDENTVNIVKELIVKYESEKESVIQKE